jgi:hypothetical protein
MQKLEWSPDTIRFKEAFEEKLKTFAEQTLTSKKVRLITQPTYI